MNRVTEISIEVEYEKFGDGRYRLRSTTVPGLRLEGPNIDDLQADLNAVVKDLLFHNLQFVVDSVRWVPSLEDMKNHLTKPVEGKATYVAKVKAAA